MRITTLSDVLKDNANLGKKIQFVDDLKSDVEEDFQDISYMVIKDGILDLNKSYDVIKPWDSMLELEVLIVE